MNPLEFSRQLATLVRSTVAKSLDVVGDQLTTLSNRIKVLEDAGPPKDGQDGMDGKDGRDGVDGKDGQDAATPTVETVRMAVLDAPALPDLLAATVAKHLELNPVPVGEQGLPGNDGQDGADGQDAPAPTHDTIVSALAAQPDLLLGAVAMHLKAYPPADGKDGQDGQDGTNGSDGLDGKDGSDGKDGADGTNGQDGQDAPAPTAELLAQCLQTYPDLVTSAVTVHLQANPPTAGQDGINGQDGRDGNDAPAPTPEAIAAALTAQPELVASAVAQHLQAYPPMAGKDGKDADPQFVRQVTKEFMDANPALAGQDGTSVTIEDVQRQLDSMHAQWQLDFERRAMEFFHRTVERMPVPKDGVDGLGFDDLTMQYDGERTAKFVFMRGDVRKEFAMQIPAIIHRGIFKKDAAYQPGDLTTWGGSMWLAKNDTQNKQPGTSTDWQLVVKCGRDGKDAK